MNAHGCRGVLNIVHGTHDTVNRMLDHPDIRAISFVGSDNAARYVYERAGKHGKRVQVPPLRAALQTRLFAASGQQDSCALACEERDPALWARALQRQQPACLRPAQACACLAASSALMHPSNAGQRRRQEPCSGAAGRVPRSHSISTGGRSLRRGRPAVYGHLCGSLRRGHSSVGPSLPASQPRLTAARLQSQRRSQARGWHA